MLKRTGFLILILVLAMIVAGCSSSSRDAQPSANLEKQAALNSTMDKAALADKLQGSYVKIGSDIEAASFMPPQLNKSVVDADIAAIDAYSAALTDFKTASARYRSFLNNGSAEFQQAMSNESAADAKLSSAGDLKKELGLINDWLAEYAVWSPVNDTAGERVKEMLYFASLTQPYQQSSPAEGIRFFNQARPQFVAYLNESATMTGKTDALIAVMSNSTAKDSLTKFRSDVTSMNSWVKTNYNLMVDTYNQKAGSSYGMQTGI